MAVLFLGYGDGPKSAVPPVFTGLCAPVVIAALGESRRSSAASSALRNSFALSCSSSSSLLLRFTLKLYFDLLRQQQHSKRRARRARKARRERPPMIPPTTVEVCWPLELGGIADEVCVIHEEDVLLELVIAVVAVTSVPRMGDTEVSDSILPIEKWLLVGGVSTLEGLAVISDMRLFQVGKLVTSCDVVAAAGLVISDVITSDIVTVAVNEVIISDTVTVKVVVFSSGIVGDKS